VVDFFSNIELDKQSFWLGFVAGAIFIWFVTQLRVYLPRIITYLKNRYQEIREGLTSGAEIRYRNELLNYVQQLHITSITFSLDEIIVPPSLMEPSRVINIENESVTEDIVNLTIPYLPDWSELAATYNAPTLTLSDALSNGANLILIGYPGSGRTVSLAYLATLILRKEVNNSTLDNLLPIFFHAREIESQSDEECPIENIIKLLSKNLSTLTQQRLPALIKNVFEKRQVLLLIDGLDEVSADKYQVVKQYIQTLLDIYPDTRLVVTTSPNNFTGLPQMGLIPMFIAAWNANQIETFINNFSQMWRRFINSNESLEEDKFDYLLIRSWLESHNKPQGPLELTLRIWSTFAGDLIGAPLTDNIETYIRRTTTEYPEARPVLEQIASQMLLGESFTVYQEEIISLYNERQQENNADFPDINAISEAEPADIESKLDISEPSIDQTIQEIIQGINRTGLLVSIDDQIFRFSHPVIACYLAGSAFSKSDDINSILDQENWAGKTSTIEYYLHFSNNGENIINKFLDKGEMLQSKSLRAARWLKPSSTTSSWYSEFVRYLASKFQNEALTMSLSGQFLTALTFPNDPHISALLRKMLTSEQANIRQLAALGCGLIPDIKSVSELANLINDPIPGVSRAALLALVAIGDKKALETVATSLLQGSEMVRRYAAEALANHPEEGHPALRDGSSMEDLLVRRAVVFGLARINQSWATEILERMQIDDQQWLVRNAAVQALEDINRPTINIPMPSVPLSDVPWLIEFASKLGIGVVPGKPAIDMLIRVLRDGDEEVRLLALDYLRINGFEEAIPAIIDIYHSSLGELREAAYNTLWHLSASGFDINYQPELQT
jgi:HEAT repeat protein